MEHDIGKIMISDQVGEYTTPFDVVKKLGRLEMPLPDHIPTIVHDQSDSLDLFQRAYDMWSLAFDRERLRTAITTLSSGEMRQEYRNEIERYCAGIRQIGFILQSAWIGFSADHKAPEFHTRLVSALGKLKDSLHYKRRVSPQEAVLYINHCLDMYPEDGHIMSSFRPTDHSSFVGKQLDIAGHLDTLIDAERLTMRQLHHIRKDGSRPLMNMFLLATLRGSSPDVQAVYFSLRKLDHELGRRRNKVLEGKIRNDHYLTVDNELKSYARRVRDMFH